MPILGIAKWLRKRGVPTRSGQSKWLPSAIRGVLRNPAYKGQAAFGRRTYTMDTNGVIRRRWRGKFARGIVCRERPKEEWISIPVPAIITADVFDLAQERLKKNEHFSERNTKYHTLLQGILVCGLCGYAIYRVSGPKTSVKGEKLHYYRCSCSERWRMGANRVCPNRPIRQDYLDELVWSQVVELLENPEVIRVEIDRRVQQAQQSNPMQVRKESLVKEQIRIRSGMDRLLDAYQEGLLPLADLRQRIPDLKKREAALSSELESLEMNFIDQQQRLQLTENLEELMKRLHQSVNSLSLADRQKVLRLIVKEIVVSPEGITIKHSIPIAQNGSNDPNYQLHTHRQCFGAQRLQ
jgi:site-specific DNA recombinase